jgi:GT2 family glycosyltransferase
LDSIFIQTYENIELIVSNDGADNFDCDSARAYAEANRSDNIKKIIVNKNEKNAGTVKHCNIALGLAGGEYIMFIACDDVYNNKNAVKDMADGFKKAPPDVMSVVGQTAMYDKFLNGLLWYYIPADVQEKINGLTPYELYENYLSHKPVLAPASTIYKKEIFEKYGKFDERFFLVEDWSSSISYAKQGMRSYYLDILCVNHRDGGISKSKASPDSFAHKMYWKDMVSILEESMADAKSFSRANAKKVKNALGLHKYHFDRQFALPLLKPRKKIFAAVKTVVKNGRLTHVVKKNLAVLDLYKLLAVFAIVFLLNDAGMFELFINKNILKRISQAAVFIAAAAALIKSAVKIAKEIASKFSA